MLDFKDLDIFKSEKKIVHLEYLRRIIIHAVVFINYIFQ